MANYTKSNELLDEGERKRIYYLYGDERSLVERTAAKIKRVVAAPPDEVVNLRCGEHVDRLIHGSINAYPSDPLSTRLVTIRDAHKLSKELIHAITDWMDSRHIPQTTIILIASGDGNEDLIARITKHGRTVKCSPSADEAIAIVAHASLAPRDVAEKIVAISGTVTRALDALDKIKILGHPPDPRLIAVLCEPAPSDLFTDHLIGCHRALAADAATQVEDSLVAPTISLLERKLTQIDTVARAVRRNIKVQDIIRTYEIPPFAMPKLLQAAKHYPREEVLRRYQVLNITDSLAQRGMRTGVLTALAALW